VEAAALTSASKTLLATALLLAMMRPAQALGERPVLHEPIAPDPREDLAMRVALDGELPGALQTPSGIVGAPDPRQLPASSEATYGPTVSHDAFVPDRDTRRPDVSAYDDPFTPSTAPFKRLDVYDAVHSDYRLYVRDERVIPVTIGPPPGQDDEAFYADIVVDLLPDARVRIPSVGPGARMVRGRLGLGADDLGFRVFRDGADNWFLQPTSVLRGHGSAAVRARLVMEIAIPRAALGGPLGDASWGSLVELPALPDNVARDAMVVRAAIGVSHAMRPRAAIAKLVQYFRGFTDSDDLPQGMGNVYLDLALSKKGVCRHRAFAFLVTAQSLGIPTRVVMNEAHAWVEVHDGTLWRRIDLGGAGRMTSPAPPTDRPPYVPLPDALAWPRGSVRGDDMVAEARAHEGASNTPAPASPSATAPSRPLAAQAPSAVAQSPSSSPSGPPSGDDGSPFTVSLSVMAGDAHRGRPLPLRGRVVAAGDPCPHVAVEVWLRDPKTQRTNLLGTMATGDDGTFAGSIVVPGSTPLGDYDVVAKTRSGTRYCGGAF
jgi:transglutaminase-like putative cysteine protease